MTEIAISINVVNRELQISRIIYKDRYYIFFWVQVDPMGGFWGVLGGRKGWTLKIRQRGSSLGNFE